MIEKKILNPSRVRRIAGGFSFIPHRFLKDGFFASLNQHELLLYLFLVVASDRNGLSYYAYDSICTLLEMSLDEYIGSRNALIEKDLVAFDGTLYQVLELPPESVRISEPKTVAKKKRREGPANLASLLKNCIKEA